MNCLSRLASVALAGGLLLAQSQPPAPGRKPSRPADWKPAAHEMFIPYWTVEPGWGTQLEIRNNVKGRSLSVTPVLRTLTGREVPLPPVTVSSDDIQMLDLRQALSGVAPDLLDRAGSFGSILCRYNANARSNIFAASMVSRDASPIAFHFDEGSADSSRTSGSIESIWWLPQTTASDELILSNASSQPLNAAVTFSDGSGQVSQQALAIGAAETVRLDVRPIVQAAHLSGNQGGISVSVSSGAGALLTSHIVFDESAGMSAILKTFDRDPAEQVSAISMRAPMLALATPDPVLKFPAGTTLIPQLFFRNATAAPLNASLALNWHSASGLNGTLPLSGLSLLPGEVRTLKLTDFTAQAQLPPDAFWAAVLVKYQGRYGDIVPVATSFDASGRYGLQTPFSSATAHLWKGSMWHVETGRDSLITAGNGGTAPTHAAVTLFYHDGKDSYTIEKLLQPEEQIWVDVGELIRDQVPDKDGKTIPADVTMGSYELRDLDHIGVGYVFEGKLVLDKTFGHGYYGCASCCGYLQAALNPADFYGAIGTGGYTWVGASNGCDNSWDDVTYEAYNWFSADTSIATLPNPYANFVGVGGTSGNASVELQMESLRGMCPQRQLSPNNNLNTCGPPQAETTSFYQWGDNDPRAGDNASAAGFIQVLTPTSAAYLNGTVSENNASPATDSCYFDGSSYPPVAGVSGSQWTVGASAQWGPDYVGYTYAAFGYYQTTRPGMGLPMPCGFTMFQQLSFQCPSGNPAIYDSPVILQATISGTGITVTREGVSVARTLMAY